MTVPAPKSSGKSTEHLFDVVQKIEGALYLGVAMPSSGHFLGCEFFSDTRQAHIHVQNATIAPGRVSFNGTSMPLGRPSTMSNRPPYVSNPNWGRTGKEGRWPERLRRPRIPSSFL